MPITSVAWQAASSQFKEIATVVPSATASSTYGWLGQFPKLREWMGARVPEGHGCAWVFGHQQAVRRHRCHSAYCRGGRHRRNLSPDARGDGPRGW
ncbi:Mu-like prophage major head subunit gpT family protein [Pseudomonas sp. KSR10]|nr:Mu-like prophage major head subunit gpT family protein [Pseudomonas sp. KSR10]